MLLLPMAILTMEDDDDRGYMTRLYREYRALMLKTAWEYSKDNETVEDIVSESCIALIRHIDQLKAMDKAAIRSYIVITVRNKAIDDFRKQSLRKRVFVRNTSYSARRITKKLSRSGDARTVPT